MIGPGGILSAARAVSDAIKSVVGSLTDWVGVPYVFGVNTIIGHLNTAYDHVHGEGFCFPDYADPVLVESSAGAWTKTGTIVEIIPAGALDRPFDLHWVNILNISGNAYIKLDFFSGAAGSEELIKGGTKPGRTSNFVQEGPRRIQVPQQPAGTRISARISDSTAGTINLRLDFEGHFYG